MTNPLYLSTEFTNNDSTVNNLSAANQLAVQGKYFEAASCLKRQLDLEPENIHLMYPLGLYFSRIGDFQSAVETLSRAALLAPENSKILVALADGLRRISRPLTSIQCLMRALALGPISIYPPERLARFMAAYKLTSESVVFFEGLSGQHPDNSDVNYALALAHEANETIQPAIQILKTLLNDNPNDIKVLNSLSRLLIGAKEIEQALSCLQRILEIDRDNLVALRLKVDALSMANRYEEALSSANQLLVRSPNSITDILKAAELRSQAGISDEEELFERARKTKENIDIARAQISKSKPFKTRWDLFNYSIGLSPESGLVLEFGVASGSSLRYIANEINSDVFGFDVFTGLPENWNELPKGYFHQSKLPEIPKNAFLVKGLFEDTLPKFLATHTKPLRLAHIDCDLYSSTLAVLMLLRERIMPGSVFMFDELWNYPGWENHEWRALNEFSESSGLFYEYIGHVENSPQVAIRFL